MLQIGSALFPGVVRQLWGDKAETEWLDLQALCRWVETGLGWHISWCYMGRGREGGAGRGGAGTISRKPQKGSPT
jgi:hypothetical protein